MNRLRLPFPTLLLSLPVFLAPPVWAQTLSPAEQAAATDSIARLLRTEYVYDTTGIRCAAELGAARPGFRAPAAAAEFAAAMTLRLRRCAGDEHLEVVAAAPAAPPPPAPAPRAASPAAEPEWLPPLRARNFDVPEVRRLAGNVGYLELTSFPPPEVAGATVAAAMAVLAHTDAMIVDLRRNSGGTGDMVRFLATWFFDAPTAITATYRRADGRVTEDRTLPYVPGPRRPSVPLYLLTSRGTFSAAEAFAFGLQQLGRATVVGERTRGGANAGRYRTVGYGLRVFIPMANARSPATGKSWERVGVAPDLAAPADSALERAHAAALRRLAGAAGADSARARMLRWVLEGVLAGTRLQDAAACAALAGRYEGAREVRCAGGRLRYARGGQPERGLIALGGGDYLLEGVDDVRLRFERAGDGTTVLRVLDADGTEVRALRLSAAAQAGGADRVR
jgi:retinol-binding protein 3